MPRKRYKTEQIVAMLRQVEVLVANGRLTPQACREAGISEQTIRLSVGIEDVDDWLIVNQALSSETDQTQWAPLLEAAIRQADEGTGEQQLTTG